MAVIFISSLRDSGTEKSPGPWRSLKTLLPADRGFSGNICSRCSCDISFCINLFRKNRYFPLVFSQYSNEHSHVTRGNSMTSLYICEQGVKVNLDGGLLAFTSDGSVIKKVRIESVERVLAFGNVQFTSQCLASLSERDIPVSFHSTHGRFRYSLHQPMGKNGMRRISQYSLPATRSTN